MCATLLAPKVYCQLVSLPPFSRPPFPSRSACLLPRPPRPPLRILSVFQPALYQFKVRTLDPSSCFPSSFVLFLSPSLSFASLPWVCLLRSLVGIIPRQGNYRYPEFHNATPTHVYNRRHTREYFSVLILMAAADNENLNTRYDTHLDFFKEQTRSISIENASSII